MIDMSVLLPVWTEVGTMDSNQAVEWMDYIWSIIQSLSLLYSLSISDSKFECNLN